VGPCCLSDGSSASKNGFCTVILDDDVPDAGNLAVLYWCVAEAVSVLIRFLGLALSEMDTGLGPPAVI
jgi:hypothetical protein